MIYKIKQPDLDQGSSCSSTDEVLSYAGLRGKEKPYGNICGNGEQRWQIQPAETFSLSCSQHQPYLQQGSKGSQQPHSCQPTWSQVMLQYGTHTNKDTWSHLSVFLPLSSMKKAFWTPNPQKSWCQCTTRCSLRRARHKPSSLPQAGNRMAINIWITTLNSWDAICLPASLEAFGAPIKTWAGDDTVQFVFWADSPWAIANLCNHLLG